MDFDQLIMLRQTYDNATLEHGEAAFAKYLQQVRREYGLPAFTLHLLVTPTGVVFHSKDLAAVLQDWSTVIRDIFGVGEWFFEVNDLRVRRSGGLTAREQVTRDVEVQSGLQGISLTPESANDQGKSP